MAYPADPLDIRSESRLPAPLDSSHPEVRAFPADRYTGLGREGMVTVWDEEGRYVGCMGVETWKALVERERQAAYLAHSADPAHRESVDDLFNLAVEGEAPCRECGLFLRVRKDGRIPMHWAQPGHRTFARKWCNGSSLKPRWWRVLVGLNARIVGLDTGPHDADSPFVAHICFDIEDGPRVFIQAEDPAVRLRIKEEPRG